MPGVTSIGHSAFYKCTSLTVITLPKSVTFIGYYAFQGSSLSSILYEGTEDEWRNNIDQIDSKFNNILSIDKCTFNYVYTDVSGAGLSWELENGCLTISGSGAMTDYEQGTEPWYAERENIFSAVVEEGVTYIG